MVKKGDTLIEVLLAVGIFSMIAISVVAVMSGGTSSAQGALETTLAREEIDAQAEALRFIHDSYINDMNSDRKDQLPSVALWNTITRNAYTLNGNAAHDEAILSVNEEYASNGCPTTREELPERAFILDPRSLDDAGAYKPLRSTNVFAPVSTFPRLIFGSNSENELTEDVASTSTTLTRAEGIYVIAVADRNTTAVIDSEGEAKTGSAFYDFYIRTCWYDNNNEAPSTISTVIRLYNPETSISANSVSVVIDGSSTNVAGGKLNSKQKNNALNRTESGWDVYGWCLKADSTTNAKGEIICNGKVYNIGDELEAGKEYVSIRQRVKYTIQYNSNGSQWQYNNGQPQICYADKERDECVVQGDAITRSGYAFGGWCDGTVSSNGTCSGNTYQKGDIIYAPDGFPSSRILKLTAIWKERDETINIHASWTSGSDYDSFMYLQLPGSSLYQYANWGTDNINVTYSGQTYSLVTGAGDGRGSSNGRYYEDFTIHTLGGKNYYYSITRYSGGWPNGVGSDITITVSGPYLGTRTFSSSSARCSNGYWNIFAYKDGQIVNRNTCTSDIDYGY